MSNLRGGSAKRLRTASPDGIELLPLGRTRSLSNAAKPGLTITGTGAAASTSATSPVSSPKGEGAASSGAFSVQSSSSSSSSSSSLAVSDKDSETSFLKLTGRNPFLINTSDALKKHRQGRTVTCGWCNLDVYVVAPNGSSTSGNLTKHRETPEHIKTARTHIEMDFEASSQILVSSSSTGAAEKIRRADFVSRLRAMTIGSAVATGISTACISIILSGDVLKAANLTAQLQPSMPLGSSYSKTESDLDKAAAMMLSSMKEEVRKIPGAWYTVMADGGGRLRGKRSKVYAIMLTSPELKRPFLLTMCMPLMADEEGTALAYDHKRCIVDILAGLTLIGVPRNNVASFMSDNVNIAISIARESGMALGKCAAHAGHLVAKLAALLPYFKDTVNAGNIIFAGGGTRRALYLESKGIRASRCVPYANRFANAIEVAAYFLEHLPVLGDFFTTHASIFPPTKASQIELDEDEEEEEEEGEGGAEGEEEAGKFVEDEEEEEEEEGEGAAEGEEEGEEEEGNEVVDDDDSVDADEESEDDDGDSEDDEDGGPIGRVGSVKDLKRTAKIKAAFLLVDGLFAGTLLNTIILMFGGLPEIIKLACADSRNLSSNFLEKVSLIGSTLEEISAGPRDLVIQAISRVRDAGSSISVKQTKSLLSLLVGPVSDIAQLALAKFNKHFVPITASLRRRFLFSIRRPSPPPTLEELGVLAEAADMDLKSYMGADATQWGPGFKAEYKAFLKEWPSIPPTTDSSSYFRSKINSGAWKHLPHVALFWLNAEPGAIPCERMMGIMREANRQKVTPATFQRLMFILGNAPVADDMLHAILEEHAEWVGQIREENASATAATTTNNTTESAKASYGSKAGASSAVSSGGLPAVASHGSKSSAYVASRGERLSTASSSSSTTAAAVSSGGGGKGKKSQGK